MNCKYCRTPMQIGLALTADNTRRMAWRVGPQMIISGYYSKGALRPCLKCPTCGHSKTI